MPSTQDQDLLLSLESSARNARATFGPTSPQYLGIKYMVDEHVARMRLQEASLGAEGGQLEARGRVMNLAFRPRAQ